MLNNPVITYSKPIYKQEYARDKNVTFYGSCSCSVYGKGDFYIQKYKNHYSLSFYYGKGENDYVSEPFFNMLHDIEKLKRFLDSLEVNEIK